MTTKTSNTSAALASRLKRLGTTPRDSQPGARSTTPGAPTTTREASWWGDFLSKYDWSHWLTVTPPYPEFTPGELWSEFKFRFIRRLAFENRARVTWFGACERSPGGVYHIHALLGGTSTLSIISVAAAWRCGKVSAAVYDTARGAAWYTTKTSHLAEEEWTRWDMSRTWPSLLADIRPPRAA